MTNAKKSYSEKLKHPLWQQCRLRVMERDNFKCRKCGDTETTLNVHHKEYIRGREPWDYPLDNFITYCEDCHENEHDLSELPYELITQLGNAVPNWQVDDLNLKLIREHITFCKRMLSKPENLSNTSYGELSADVSRSISKYASIVEHRILYEVKRCKAVGNYKLAKLWEDYGK